MVSFLLLLLPLHTKAWLSTPASIARLTRQPQQPGSFQMSILHTSSTRQRAQRRNHQPPILHAVKLREWEEGDDIYSFLADTVPPVPGGFDPEGPLETDCISSRQLQESYPTDDDCCFLCAIDDSSSRRIVGTAGLIVGTQVAYMKSGSSLASYVTTGAIRRLAVDPKLNPSEQEAILTDLLSEVERRAQPTQSSPTVKDEREAVNQLIVLAYLGDGTICRPTPVLLEKLGYEGLDTVLGDTVVQYQKTLTTYDESVEFGSMSNNEISTKIGMSEGEYGSDVKTANGNVIAAATGTAALLFLAALWGIIHGMGLDASMSLASTSINGGIGTPLTTQELNRLMQDETLKRTTLGDEKDQGGSLEDLREDDAMMKIITGQDVRIR